MHPVSGAGVKPLSSYLILFWRINAFSALLAPHNTLGLAVAVNLPFKPHSISNYFPPGCMLSTSPRPSSPLPLPGCVVVAAMMSLKQLAARPSATCVRPNSRRSLKVAATSRVDSFSKNDIIVSPSILSADFARLGEEASIIVVYCSVWSSGKCRAIHPPFVTPRRSGQWIRQARTGFTWTSWTGDSCPTSPSAP